MNDMSEPYLGEIRMFAGNFAPVNWALCNGQILNISENEALYTLIGTTYGGDGQSTFALPDLRGRIPVHTNASYPLGSKAGSETVTLTTNELPTHTHTAVASSLPGTIDSPSNAVWAVSSGLNFSDGIGQTLSDMNPQIISAVGGSQPHDNMMPSLTISFIIALSGIYPSSN
jgi:microcystin-dependent protein